MWIYQTNKDHSSIDFSVICWLSANYSTESYKNDKSKSKPIGSICNCIKDFRVHFWTFESLKNISFNSYNVEISYYLY